MEDALEHLLASQERESDVLLYYLVRLQQIVQNITQVIPYDEPYASHSCGAPFVMHIKMLDKSLSDFQSSLPAPLQRHGILAFSNRKKTHMLIFRVSIDASINSAYLSIRSQSV